MKIKPTTEFINHKVSDHGEVVIVLGARKSESVSRGQVMSDEKIIEKTVGVGEKAVTTKKRRGRKMIGQALSHHKSIGGAYIYTPIEDWSTDDVWQYLISTPPPWDKSNRELITMYRNAQSGECPLVIDKSTPSCGGGRFGCWCCTVVARDRSMEAMIDNGEEWLEPLLEFRDWLTDTQDPKNKEDIREHRRRIGRVEYFYGAEGEKKIRWGPYKMEMRKKILHRLLEAQNEVNEMNPSASFQAIQPAELHRIRQLWLHDEGDWEDSLPSIYSEVIGDSLEWLVDDCSGMGGTEKQIIDEVSVQFDIRREMLVELFDIERKHAGMAKRSGIHKEIEKTLNKDWQTREEALSEVDSLKKEAN
jgi:DNA sulfur modification protein DndC